MPHNIGNRANEIKSTLGNVKEFSCRALYFAKKMILPVTINVTIILDRFLPTLMVSDEENGDQQVHISIYTLVFYMFVKY